MASSSKASLLAGLLIVCLLAAIGVYAYTQIRYLSLPVPGALALLTVILPIFTGLSTTAVARLFTQSARKSATMGPSLVAIALLALGLIYDTAVTTLALTHAVPSSVRTCSLDARWMELFRTKNAHAIQAIQTAFQCCGLHSTRDKAWPFPNGRPGEDGAGACVRAYGYTRSCAQMWEAADGMNAGLLVLIAVVVFFTKVVGMFWMFRNPSASPLWMRTQASVIPGRLAVDLETENRRRSAVRTIEGPYRDEEAETGEEVNRGGEDNHGPRIEPSGPANDGHEWRNEHAV